MWVNIVWGILQNTWPFIIGAIVFIMGYKWALSNKEKENLELEAKRQQDIHRAERKVIDLEEEKNRRIKEIRDAKTDDPLKFSRFVNDLLNKIFGKK